MSTDETQPDDDDLTRTVVLANDDEKPNFEDTVAIGDEKSAAPAVTPFEGSANPSEPGERRLPAATPFDTTTSEATSARSKPVPVPSPGLDQTVALAPDDEETEPPTADDIDAAMAKSRSEAEEALEKSKAERAARKKAREERRQS